MSDQVFSYVALDEFQSNLEFHHGSRWSIPQVVEVWTDVSVWGLPGVIQDRSKTVSVTKKTFWFCYQESVNMNILKLLYKSSPRLSDWDKTSMLPFSDQPTDDQSDPDLGSCWTHPELQWSLGGASGWLLSCGKANYSSAFWLRCDWYLKLVTVPSTLTTVMVLPVEKMLHSARQPHPLKLCKLSAEQGFYAQWRYNLLQKFNKM